MPIVEKLGKYQLEWLNKYNKIDICQWRYEYLESVRGVVFDLDWYYVGNCKEDSSKENDGYDVRRKNLKKSPYFYWPK